MHCGIIAKSPLSLLWHTQIVWSKVAWLTSAVNLTPWYLTYTGTSPTTPVSSDAGPVQTSHQDLLCNISA